jgi:endonuclease YncB( thermonuclease family)
MDAASGGTTVRGQRLYVIDGDTFDLNGERIRVAGIDAPETHPARCPREAALGTAATQKLAELLRSGTLWVSGLRTDRYGRSVRTVRVNGEDVADAMIGSGLARNYDGKQRKGWC